MATRTILRCEIDRLDVTDVDADWGLVTYLPARQTEPTSSWFASLSAIGKARTFEGQLALTRWSHLSDRGASELFAEPYECRDDYGRPWYAT